QIARSGRPDEGIDMVDDGALVDAKLRRLHPRVAIEVLGHDKKGVRDNPGGRNLKSGNSDHDIGLAQLPAALPDARNEFRTGIAFRRSRVPPLRDGFDFYFG